MDIKSQIESLLFVSAKPMAVKDLAKVIGVKNQDIEKAGDELVAMYQQSDRGLRVIKDATQYQMVSSPDNAQLIQDFIKDETLGELSRPSLETLTIIAYRGPVTKIDLDRIRGVNCALILRNLLLRGLIDAKVDKQKNETYYSVTLDFVRFLGINSIEELPEYERLNKHDSLEKILEEAEAKEASGLI